MRKEFTLRTDHNPNLALVKGNMKSYDTLTDEILKLMPFKMEFMNGNPMFVDALSRPTSLTNILAIDLSHGPICTIIFDNQVVKLFQITDTEPSTHKSPQGIAN